jgi:hypothetical protein
MEKSGETRLLQLLNSVVDRVIGQAKKEVKCESNF